MEGYRDYSLPDRVFSYSLAKMGQE
jgi:hypothetical protein